MDLSIHLRRMKFMQRCQSAELNQALQETGNKSITDEQWELDIPALEGKQSQYDTIQSHAEICNLRYGRMSFQGFNQLTEKMMKVWNNEEEPKADDSADRDSVGSISDEEMAERFTSLVGTIGKKYGKKRRSEDAGNDNSVSTGKKKRKKDSKRAFMKPKEES